MAELDKVPSKLLFRYFDTASDSLENITNNDLMSVIDNSNTHGIDLEWHRKRIIATQISALDQVLKSDVNPVPPSREVFQNVLRQVGNQDLAFVEFGDTFDNVDDTVQEFSSLGLRQRPSTTGSAGGTTESSMLPSASQFSTERQEEDKIEEFQRHRRDQGTLLLNAMDRTNEAARHAFARSVLQLERLLDRKGSLMDHSGISESSMNNENSQLQQEQAPLLQTEQKGSENEDELDRSSILEFCGLVITAMRLQEIKSYLQDGTEFMLVKWPLNLPDKNSQADPKHFEKIKDNSSPKAAGGSVEERLAYIQDLCWRAVGWDPKFALGRLQDICLGDHKGTKSNMHPLLEEQKVLETVTKYISSVNVAVSNAGMDMLGRSGDKNYSLPGKEGTSSLDSSLPPPDDGTTRVINISYSEKFIPITDSTPTDSDTASYPFAAPQPQSIHEHTETQRRRELDMAQKASSLQQHLWNDFTSLDITERNEMLQKAKHAHEEFLEEIRSTPPGPERVLVMQSIDEEVQKLLVIYKLWCAHNEGNVGNN